jgi:hypothetical protein
MRSNNVTTTSTLYFTKSSMGESDIVEISGDLKLNPTFASEWPFCV